MAEVVCIRDGRIYNCRRGPRCGKCNQPVMINRPTPVCDSHMATAIEKWLIEDCYDRIMDLAVEQQRQILKTQGAHNVDL